MNYYCFLCNENHDDSPTEEHFIPRSIDGPENQWLPVCEFSNNRSNAVFDNDARDILYWVRFKNTRSLKRVGLALLRDGSAKRFRFSYIDKVAPERDTAFNYIFDRETNEHIPNEDVSAILFAVGLMPHERTTFCRGLAKISIGAIVYLLIQQGLSQNKIRQVLSQASIDVMRHLALDLPWRGGTKAMRFSLGRSDVLERLHCSCDNQQVRNHVLEIRFRDRATIDVEGMLYSQYGWRLQLANDIPIDCRELRLENPIHHLNAPEALKDLTLTQDSICIANPELKGPKPDLPPNWRTLLQGS
jgi:hypothetical protein